MGGTQWWAERDRKWKGIDRSETGKKGIGNEWKKCVGDSQRARGKKTEFLKVTPGEQNEKLRSVQGSDDDQERCVGTKTEKGKTNKAGESNGKEVN